LFARAEEVALNKAGRLRAHMLQKRV